MAYLSCRQFKQLARVKSNSFPSQLGVLASYTARYCQSSSLPPLCLQPVRPAKRIETQRDSSWLVSPQQFALKTVQLMNPAEEKCLQTTFPEVSCFGTGSLASPSSHTLSLRELFLLPSYVQTLKHWSLTEFSLLILKGLSAIATREVQISRDFLTCSY